MNKGCVSNPWNKRIKFLIHTEVQYTWLQKPTINLITQPLKEEKKNVFAPLNLYDMFKTIKFGTQRQKYACNSSTQKIFEKPKDNNVKSLQATTLKYKFYPIK